MPSPVVVTDPATSSEHNTNSSSSNQHSSSTNNTDSSENATSDVSANSHDSRTSAQGRDAIREGKEKAKAVMAASGVNLGSLTPSRALIGDGNTAQKEQTAVNGTSHSRKRSRSGSRKPNPSADQDSKEVNAKDKHGQFLLSRYRARDVYKSSQVFTKSERHDALLQSQVKIIKEIEHIEAPLRNQHDLVQKIRTAHDTFGGGFEGWGNGWTTGESRLMYPEDRNKKRLGHKRGTRKDNAIRYNRAMVTDQAERQEDLVPIRLDIEHDKVKLRDTFTWNIHERITSQRCFAEMLVEDFKIPPEHYQFLANEVHKTISDTVAEYYPHVFTEEEDLDLQTPYFEQKNDEMRVLIKLNVTIGAHTLVDQFEWDINNDKNDAEEFAKQLAKDMSLSGEFTTAIAHQIREQTQMFTKSLYIVGHAWDGSIIEDADVRDNFLPSPIPTIFRPAQTAKEYIPFLYELNDDDLQQQELSILREQRRQKRSTTRRGGPALPDLKDRERTVRSLVVSSVLPGAAETLENARLFKFSRSSGRGRRANRVDGDSSEDSESEESETEVAQVTAGTARTRGMRGAATAAQVAMRAAMGRSQTPELASLHHHETRTTSRSLRYEVREESVAEPTSMIVKLRISPARYRQWLRTYQSKPKSEYPQAGQISTLGRASQANTPQQSGPAMPPPPSPAPTGRNTPGGSSRGTPAQEGKWRYHPDGSVDAPNGIIDDTQVNSIPPPPPWLAEALDGLRRTHPRDSFEGWMKPLPADKRTGQQIKPDDMEHTPKESIVSKWFPRIKCLDCPGKVYTAKPGDVVDNFMVHLKNRAHRERVDSRLGNKA